MTTADRISPMLISPVAMAAALYGGTETKKKVVGTLHPSKKKAVGTSHPSKKKVVGTSHPSNTTFKE